MSSLKHNLQDSLNALSENIQDYQLSGFRYAPTASANISPPAVFNFDTAKSNNSKSCAIKAVSDIGFLDLQSFQRERLDGGQNGGSYAVPQQHNSSTYNNSILSPVKMGKPAASAFATQSAHPQSLVQPPIAPSRHPAVVPAFNIQDEISKFEAAIPDSLLIELDFDAIVNAELEKENKRNNVQQKTNTALQNPPSSTSYSESCSVSGSMVHSSLSGMQQQNRTASLLGTESYNAVPSNITTAPGNSSDVAAASIRIARSTTPQPVLVLDSSAEELPAAEAVSAQLKEQFEKAQEDHEVLQGKRNKYVLILGCLMI
jgi:hypothetical protein